MAEEKERSSVESVAKGANWATILATIVAAIALTVSIYTYWETTNLQQRTAAFTYWQIYLQLAFSNPEFASGIANDADPKEKQKYEWFASNALGAGEAVFMLQRGDKGWESTIKTLIRTHRKYIESPAFEREHFNDQFVSLVDTTLKEK